MTWIPKQPDHTAWGTEPVWPEPRLTMVTVHALNENKRPIGFAPWPKAEEETPK